MNVGMPQQLSVRRGRPMMSAIVKEPVEGPVRVEGVNLAGDAQADLRVHGGPYKAVYAYAREDSDWWARELGREIPNGMFGENLTLEGVDVSNAVIGERWRIGTVDKFQGLQAPVVFFSMTASSGEDVPRGMDFLFSRNRLNVAISRARALAIVVCSPRLLWARCNTVEQMRLVNALCSFAEEAERQAAAAAAPAG